MTTYESVIDVCKPFMGPASEQFIRRQCSLHLKLEAEKLSKSDLAELTKCVEVGGLRFMEADKVKELASKLARL